MQLALVVLLLCIFIAPGFSAAPPDKLAIRAIGGQPEIRIEKEPVPPVAGTRYRLQIEASSDLKAWSPEGELLPGTDTAFSLGVSNAGPYKFFRLRPEIEDAGTPADGAEVFGYDRIFREELRRVGFLTPEQFASLHDPSSNYLASPLFDPRRANYWDAFSADPAVVNAGLTTTSPGWRSFDFRLNPAELEIFRNKGFVVSERLGSYSFADVFYRIFNDDLPVFVSADAALHAWHFSFQRLLEESEETQLTQALRDILDGLKTRLVEQSDAVRNGPLRDSLADADYFVAVARSLLSGQQQATVLGGDQHVSETLTNITKLAYVPDFELWGTNRDVDFSQFKIRGHYERSVGLGRYFQAFMWTARTDLRIFWAKSDPQSLRELGTAVVLAILLQTSGQSDHWRQLDDLIRLFVGRTDEMTFAQLQPLLNAAGITSLEAVTSVDQLAKLQQDIVQGNLGVQLIPGDVYYAGFGPEQTQLSRSFAFTGQRFVPDGWALGQVTYDRIIWNEEVPGVTLGLRVIRRYPSALDVAYSVLGNRQIGWEIGQRMLDTASRAKFRDGLPYAHNLTAVAATIDRLSPDSWEDSIYTRWLAALRMLSAPTTDARFPQAMRTRAWAMRTLNTQLASYTELKHDTVLYAKQPYSSSFICEYPAGFVEPVPEFWRQMKELAEAAAAGLERLPATGVIEDPRGFGPPIDLAQRKAARVAFCHNFAQQMATLEILAAKEQQQQPFTDTETGFIKGLMNRQDHPYYGPTFDGWYPGLFYKDYGQMGSADSNGSNKSDPLVTDIHTAPPDGIDPTGGVLHQGTGNVDLMLIAVDNGPDRMMYAGPVMSHYEFIVPGPSLTRMSDSEWQANLSGGRRPSRPEWTRSYLIPKQ
jgi:hypothetical protein